MHHVNQLMDNRGVQIFVGASAATAAAVAAGLAIRHLLQRRRLDKARKFWAAQPEDLVILHQFPRGLSTLSLSPFPIKVETFLRLHEIKYINDFEFRYSPDTNKSPWITINGENISDSQLIIEFLAKKFGIDLGGSLNAKDKATARAMRILMEDHLYWILMVERYVHHEARHLKSLICRLHNNDNIHNFIFEKYRRSAVKKLTQQTYCQGLGRHNKGDLQRMGIEDLQAISNFLGSKTFMLGGDKPSDLDCVLFGFMVFIIYSSPDDSAFKPLIEKRLTNLVQHTKLIRSKFFPDWDELLKEPIIKSLELPKPDDQDKGKDEADTAEAAKTDEKTTTATPTAATSTTATASSTAAASSSSTTAPRKASNSDKVTPTTPTRKLSSASSADRAPAAKKPVTNGTEKKDSDPSKPSRPATLQQNSNATASPKRSTAAKPVNPTPVKPVNPTTAAPSKTTPTSPVSPISPTGATPKFTSTPASEYTSRKASINSSASSNKMSAKVLTNGASNVLKSMLGKKKN